MRSHYDLARKIAGFDFLNWLVMQTAHGATEIAFDPSNPKTDKFTAEEVAQRYESILKPACALAGVSWIEVPPGTKGGELVPGGQVAQNEFCRRGGQFPRLRSVLPPGSERFTVTLRNTRRWPNRNSRDAEWRTFAAEIGARVIEDYDVEPIGLHERMALYEGAEMNFFVTNGPLMLCILGTAPAMCFDVQNSPPQGIPFGGSYPYLLPQHRQIWEPDTLENIRKHFEACRQPRWT